ncbi:hypothetical protein MMC10_007205 [Thelotrema lepadinum]|nr:hypothetical protein [Thelotrema lepadinum]
MDYTELPVYFVIALLILKILDYFLPELPVSPQKLDRKQPRQRPLQRQTTDGTVLWIRERQDCAEHKLKASNLPDGAYHHPALVVRRNLSSHPKHALICVLTTMKGRNVEDARSRYVWHQYIPIFPLTKVDTSQPQLFFEERNNLRAGYVNVKNLYTIHWSALKQWRGFPPNSPRLTSDSIKTVEKHLRRHGYAGELREN